MSLDRQQLEAALPDADLRVLLMVLFHFTNDEKWLAPQADYMRAYNDGRQDMIWMHPGMTTYYRNSKGRVYSVMPWRLVDYWHMTRTPDLDDYQTG